MGKIAGSIDEIIWASNVMKYAIMVLALVGVLARPTAAIAETTGNEMLELCKKDPSICMIFAAGWRSGHNVALIEVGLKKGISEAKIFDAMKRASPTGSCLPFIVTNTQLGDVLMNHLRAHPETRHQNIGVLALAAFIKAFPCPTN